MSGGQWRVERWTNSGVHTGYRVLRGVGQQMEIDASYVGNCYIPGTFDVAQLQAEARVAALNGQIDHVEFLDWPNGLGFTPCSEQYRKLADMRDVVCDVQAGGNINDLTSEDYELYSRIDDALAGLQLAGHIGQGERI